MNEERRFTASEVLMLMLDCGTSAAQLFGQVPGFRMQAEFILSSKDDDNAKRLAFHSLLLNIGSKILTDYANATEHGNEPDEQTGKPEQDGVGNGRPDEI